LQFESRMRLQGHNGNNSGKLKENTIAIWIHLPLGVWDVGVRTYRKELHCR
jgi:hypothetical protein